LFVKVLKIKGRVLVSWKTLIINTNFLEFRNFPDCDDDRVIRTGPQARPSETVFVIKSDKNQGRN
jgi:hypothetical protein